MNLKNIVNSPITSKKLEEKGQRMYKIGKILSLIGIGALILTVLIGLISLMLGGEFIQPFIFDIGGYEFAGLFVVIDYLGILAGMCGIFLYFGGMKLFGLGRIASNTEKE